MSQPAVLEMAAFAPSDVHHDFVSYLAAVLRHLQEAEDREGIALDTGSLLRRLTKHTRDTQAGHIHGLALAHESTTSTWLGDCQKALKRLQGHFEAPSRTSYTGKAQRPASTTATSEQPVWEEASLTRGKSALLFGGDPREESRTRLQSFFELLELEWPASDGDRSAQRWAERLRQGSFEVLILLLRFVTHAQSDALVSAARAAGIPVAFVDQGYGSTQIAQALESALSAQTSKHA
ncbi:MAG: hypothetical protein AAF851_21550 [Myxococcota bacterium]